jgi:hypothetical protein
MRMSPTWSNGFSVAARGDRCGLTLKRLNELRFWDTVPGPVELLPRGSELSWAPWRPLSILARTSER